MRPIDLIVVHCSDTPDALDIGPAEIRRWHVTDNGRSDIGHHHAIRRDGRIETGRPLEQPWPMRAATTVPAPGCAWWGAGTSRPASGARCTTS